MKKLYISNTFSLGMINRDDQSGSSMYNRHDHCNDHRRSLYPLCKEEVLEIISYVRNGHLHDEIVSVITCDKVALLTSTDLDIDLKVNTDSSVKLGRDDKMIIVQNNGDVLEYWII